MKSRALIHLSDGTLRHKLDTLVASDRTTTAELLAHIGEFDGRRLYAADGFPSMHAYCVQRLRFSDDMAFKRIRAARAARKFPAILAAIGDGRLHLTGVVMLCKYLKRENARELLEACNAQDQGRDRAADRAPLPASRRADPGEGASGTGTENGE